MVASSSCIWVCAWLPICHIRSSSNNQWPLWMAYEESSIFHVHTWRSSSITSYLIFLFPCSYVLTGAPVALVKHTKKGNYYHKRKLFLTFYKLITQFQCINYYIISFLICLTSSSRAPVNMKNEFFFVFLKMDFLETYSKIVKVISNSIDIS